jgi:ribose transport system substrate-binding protein
VRVTKKMAMVAGAASLLLLATGCSAGVSGTAEPGGGEIRIAYLAAFTNHDWAQTGIAAATQTAEAGGATIEVFDAQSDPTAQYAQVQDIVTSGRFDGMVIMTVDGPSIVPAVEEAVAAGLGVVDVAFPVGDDLTTRDPQVDGMVGSVVISAKENGQTLADIVIQACEGIDPCKVGILPGSLTVSADAARVREIESVLADQPNVQVAAMQETGYTTDGAYGVAQTILTATPDLNLFIAIGSESVVGAERAVVDAGLEGKVKLAGGACSSNATTALEEGRYFACYRGTPIEDNQAAVDLILKWIKGEPIGDNSPDPGADAWPDVVTKVNLEGRVGEWTD